MDLVQSAYHWITSQAWVPYVVGLTALVVMIAALAMLFQKGFGKGSSVNCAVAATLSLVLVYFGAIVIRLHVPPLAGFVVPMPFLTISEGQLELMNFFHQYNDAFYAQLLQLFLLSFIVNLLEGLIPDGKNFLSWCLWRVLVVLCVLAPYAALYTLITSVAPSLFGIYARIFVWMIFGVILLAGLFKGISALCSTALNPMMAGLYDMCYTNPVGKHLSKALISVLFVMGFLFFCWIDGTTTFVFAAWPAALLTLLLAGGAFVMFLLVRFL